MTLPREISGRDGWTERYEQLRRHALGESLPPADWGLGLETLLQKGLATWMQTAPLPVPEGGGTTAAGVTVTGGWLAACSRETTLVLAAMTLPQIVQIQTEAVNAR